MLLTLTLPSVNSKKLLTVSWLSVNGKVLLTAQGLLQGYLISSQSLISATSVRPLYVHHYITRLFIQYECCDV